MQEQRLIDANEVLGQLYCKLAGTIAIPQRSMLFGIIKKIEDAPTISPRDWTPCAEGLPEDNMAVYVSYEVFGNYYPTIAFIRNGEWANIYGYPMNKEKVIAWLHLPEPYNPDRKEERQ